MDIRIQRSSSATRVVLRGLLAASAGLVALPAAGHAQLTSAAPFVGAYSEGFETQTSGVQTCASNRVFSMQADLCGATGLINFTSGWSFGCPLSPHSGTQLLGGLSGAIEILFDTEASRFGGYFANNTPSSPNGLVRFFDANGALLFSDTVVAPNDCSWTWNGWDFGTTSVKRIELEGNHSGGGFLLIDDLEVDVAGLSLSFCFGDGGSQPGCTSCPCNNEAPVGSGGGCLNSGGFGTLLESAGDTSVSLPSGSVTDLRFSATGAPPMALCILNSGAGVAPGNPANPCFGLDSGAQSMAFDGLRCAIGNTRRHGVRPADINGAVGLTNAPWGGEGGPPVGIAQAGGGFISGQTRFFQIVYLDDPLAVCTRGLNTSQAIGVTFTP